MANKLSLDIGLLILPYGRVQRNGDCPWHTKGRQIERARLPLLTRIGPALASQGTVLTELVMGLMIAVGLFTQAATIGLVFTF